MCAEIIELSQISMKRVRQIRISRVCVVVSALLTVFCSTEMKLEAAKKKKKSVSASVIRQKLFEPVELDIDGVPHMLEIGHAEATGPGKTESQDYSDVFRNSAGYTLVVVADGITHSPAGTDGGEAARYAVKYAGQVFERFDGRDPVGFMQSLVGPKVNKDIFQHKTAGQTVFAAALIDPFGNVTSVNLGDSNVGHYSSDLKQSSVWGTEHTVAAELVAAGRLAVHEADNHPTSSQVTQYLGVHPDTFPLEKRKTYESVLFDKSAIAVASDGVTGLRKYAKTGSFDPLLRASDKKTGGNPHKMAHNLVAYTLPNEVKEQHGLEQFKVKGLDIKTDDDASMIVGRARLLTKQERFRKWRRKR